MNSHAKDRLDEWVAQAAAGDRSALESLLLYFHDPLRQFIAASISLTDSLGATHDDVFQETIVAAIRGMRGIEPQGADAFFSWLKTIACNCHRNMIQAARAKKRGEGQTPITKPEDSNPAATSILHQIAGPGQTPSLIYRRKEVIEAIARAITQLSAEQRQLINLHYHSRLSIHDLAAQMGKSEPAIRTAIHRIHKNLRDMLAAQFGDSSTGL